MKIVVCRHCDKIVRLVGPAKATGRTFGVCRDHYNIERESISKIVCRETVELHKAADCLEACVASLHRNKQEV